MVKREKAYIILFIILAIGIMVHVQPASMEAGSQLTESTDASADGNMEPFYWVVGIIGGCIVITLSYVSFRKYKGEKKKQKETDKTVD
ncbi:sporulation protein YpjB [Virgibacillus natechei]|uniref:sporulation protein YpjB n=1 Tax=Virgibacillus sp. CBA3643 TaxID=2942278 RepID=UPI0035A3A97F